MFGHTHHRRLIATAATTAALAAGAPAASASPVDNGRYPAPQPERVTVVHVQGEDGLDWGDAGVGAAGMLALVLIGFGGVRAVNPVPAREQSIADS
jgi:hypothetical protein